MVEKELIDIEADLDEDVLGEKLVWFLEQLKIDQGPIYFKQNGNHIEIGRAQIHCIE